MTAASNVASFPATPWSLVARASRAGGDDRRESLGLLLQRYLPALRTHLVVARQVGAERADDLLQGFVADKVVEQDLIAAAERERGKFRSFLRVALNRYVVDQRRREHAARRHAPGEQVPLDDQAGP